MRQATEVIRSEKRASRRPAKIAPMTLVAAKVTARSTRESKMVPKLPMIRVVNAVHTQVPTPKPFVAEVARAVAPRKTTAIPKTTHKKAGVKAICR